ncbi:MAG: hypothetical protein ACT4P7_05145 [Gemmatimonadaceae bacterium]
MTARTLVEAWRTRIAATAALCSLAIGIGVAALTRVAAEWLGGDPPQAVALALTAGFCAGALELMRRVRGELTSTRVALWVEEQAPAMQYALVSAVEADDATGWCEARVRAVDVAPAAWRALARALRGPAIVAAAGVVVLLAAPPVDPVSAAARRLIERTSTPGSALSSIRARIVPPAYSRLAPERINQPDILRPLVGSTLHIEGRLPEAVSASDVVVSIDRTRLRSLAVRDGWSVVIPVDTVTRVVRLAQGGASRLVIIEPRTDSLPAVLIQLPLRDTVLRAGNGTVALRARASDDLGLVSAAFEYIVSSGEGERFTFTTGTLGIERSAGARLVDLAASLDLAALRLRPGDVVHLRAVAQDGNTVSGPGVGASDTRSIRIARLGEYDSVAVEAAPPPEADKSLLSQRMLINLTEALLRRVPTLERTAVVSESRRIGRDQARLRKQVSDLVFARLGDDPQGEHFHGDGHAHNENEPLTRTLTPAELLQAAERATNRSAEVTEAAHDETPIIAINRPLLEAYNAMWDAGRELDAGQPRAALPPMYAALAAIQKARTAERLYLRGTPPRVVVDVGRVRLQGRERGQSAVRTARPRVDPVRRSALDRMTRALSLTSGGAAADSLLLVRLTLVGRFGDAAEAMSALIGDLREGRSITPNAERVRRLLDAGGARADRVSLWGGRGWQ